MDKVAELLTITSAAKLLGQNAGSVRRKCVGGKFIGAKKENGKWLIPTTANEKLRSTKKQRTSYEQLAHLSARKRDLAVKRIGIIDEFEKYAASFVRHGGGRQEALKMFASLHNLAARTFYRWLNNYRQFGPMGLVDGRGGGDSFDTTFSVEAANTLMSMYLKPQKLSLKRSYYNLLHINTVEEHNWQIPSLRSVYNWVDNNIPEPVQILHREGQSAYEAKCCPYIQCEPDSFASGECWVGDHHRFNFFIRHRNKWIRPWLTAWTDMRSRALVGWYLSANPNQTTVLLAMRNGIETYGPPDAVKIDNGRDYDSQMWTGQTKANRKSKGYLDKYMVAGLYAMMNISVTFSIPYRPQSKPIERFFATVDAQFSRTIETWCGKDIASKPPDLQDKLKSQRVIDNALTFETLAEVFGQWGDAYNNSAHTGEGMNSRTPNRVMSLRFSKRVISADVLDMLLCVWSGDIKVGKNGVRFKNLLYGQYEPRVLQMFGKKVRVAYNPKDLRTVTVYEAESLQRVCIAEQNELIKYGSPVAEEAMREAQRKKASVVKAHKNYIDKAPMLQMDLTDLTIKAMNDANKKNKAPEKSQPTLRPVKTKLDLHVADHAAEKRQRVLKKAAGAENAAIIDIDLSTMGYGPKEKVKLFDD